MISAPIFHFHRIPSLTFRSAAAALTTLALAAVYVLLRHRRERAVWREAEDWLLAQEVPDGLVRDIGLDILDPGEDR